MSGPGENHEDLAGLSGGTHAITTWNYDGARGWLTSKDYADASTGNVGTTASPTTTQG